MHSLHEHALTTLRGSQMLDDHDEEDDDDNEEEEAQKQGRKADGRFSCGKAVT